MAKKIALELDVDVVVRVDEDHGGYLGGKCIACGEYGWLDPRYGYPHKSKKGLGNEIHHKLECPMNAHLNNNGSLKK